METVFCSSIFRSCIFDIAAGRPEPGAGLDGGDVCICGRPGDHISVGGAAGKKKEETPEGREKEMTLEERKRIVNLALEANVAANGVKFVCLCCETGAVYIIGIDKETNEELASFMIKEDDRTTDQKYRECETYLKGLLRSEEKMTEGDEEMHKAKNYRLNENNKVRIGGTVTSSTAFSHELFGEKFYRMDVSVKRESEILDTVPVTVSEKLFDTTRENRGRNVQVSGAVRSHNRHDGEKNRLEISVLAKEITFGEEENNAVNSVVLDGYICKAPVYRKTPLGRERLPICW